MRTHYSLYNYSKSGFCRVPGTLSSYAFVQRNSFIPGWFSLGPQDRRIRPQHCWFSPRGSRSLCRKQKQRRGVLIVDLLGLQLGHVPTPTFAMGAHWGPKWWVLSTHFCFPMPQVAFEKCSFLGPSQAKRIRSLGYGTLIFWDNLTWAAEAWSNQGSFIDLEWEQFALC